MIRKIVTCCTVVWVLACGNGVNTESTINPPVVHTSAVCKSPQKITSIYRHSVYDLAGYEGIGGNSPFNLFDENDNNDPKNGVNSNPETNPHPIYSVDKYFAKNKGNRIVVDLLIPYKLTEIYFYDRARTVDSVWIYTGNMQNWKLKSAFATKGDAGRWGWNKLSAEDSTRFLMIRFSSFEANITELVLYGCALKDRIPVASSKYNGPRLPLKPMKEFIGVNCYQGTPLQFMKPFYYNRMYMETNLIDNDTVNNYPNNKFWLVPKSWWNNGSQSYVFFADSIVRFNKTKIWYSILGVPLWMEKKGYWNFDRPVTRIGMDTEDPLSYARHARMFWNLAATYGTTPVDTNLLDASNSPKFSGANLMTLYENGNETDAYWGKSYTNPIEYFAQSSADYDGHERKLGPKHGLKNADIKSELMMSGLVGLDTNRVRILKFLCDNLRSDKQFLWTGGIQYHHYSTNGKGDLAGLRFNTSTAGITPEEDSLRSRLAKVRDFSYRTQPGVECILGEYGYDKSRKSIVSAPLVKGYTQSQSQGIMIIRAINATAFSGFDRFILYWVKDVESEDHPAYYLTSGILKQVGPYELEPYAGWYYISTFVHHLAGYVPEKIISEKSNVWVYKYRNKTSPDSAAYFVYCPTRKGMVVEPYELKIGKTASAIANEVSLADKSASGNVSTRAIRNGIVRLRVTESPKIILLKESR